MSKTFGYIRVSSKDQNLNRQLDDMLKMGIDERDIYIDEQSGKDFERPSYQALKQCLRKGDILVIKELDRLGRDYEGLKREWYIIVEELGVNINLLDTPILNTTNKSDLEKQLIKNIVFELYSYLAEKERQKIKTRQAEGIAAAQKRGKHLGRPKASTPENFATVYKQWKNNELSAVESMKVLNLTKSTFYKLVKQYEGK
ncbi:recombinase family protein [Gottfriedia acidiceleris]|uniref:recombinase family protein n=1 Tax=Gottfriedia acidiceleris TaxID=371036 RepID=UPI00101C42F4|nr:recombinase family protein [Gottfriedia acidiceleris]